MDISKITFSPCGGTQRVADILASNLGEVIVNVDLCSQNFRCCNISDADIAVVAVPVYAGRIPRLAAMRLMQIYGNGMNALLVAVYGNREFEDALVELEDILCKRGFNIVGAVSAIAQHSIVTSIASTRPDREDEKKLIEFAKIIKKQLKAESHTKPVIPGSRPYRKDVAGPVPFANSNCIECGRCSSECPVGAISANNPKTSDKELCIGCMRCVKNCPMQARQLSPEVVEHLSKMLQKTCLKRKEPELFI